MRLIHFSREPFDGVHWVQQFSTASSTPRGFWFAAFPGNATHQPEIPEGTSPDVYSTQIILHYNARVAILQSARDIDVFTQDYGSIRVGGARRPIVDRIMWAKVAERYDGIVISPFCRERHDWPEAAWYYPWESAAGCIWNPRAIAVIVHLKANRRE